MAKGWIKLWKDTNKDPFYLQEPFTKWQAKQDLFLEAAWGPEERVFRGVAVKLQRGQLAVTEGFLAKRWQWSRGKVRRFLDELEKQTVQVTGQQTEQQTVQLIVQQKNNLCTLISIPCYDYYQGDGTADDTADGTADGTRNGTQTKKKKKEEGSNPPKSPLGDLVFPAGSKKKSKSEQKVTKVLSNTSVMVRIGSWFNRKPTTLWTVHEARLLEAVRGPLTEPPVSPDQWQDEVLVVEKAYRDRWKYRKRNLDTLLGNWTSFVDACKQRDAGDDDTPGKTYRKSEVYSGQS